MRNWKTGLTTAALLAMLLQVLNSASTRGQEGQTISPNGEWAGHVVFAKTEEHTPGTKNYEEKYRCPIELTLRDRVFDEWFRCARNEFKIHGSFLKDGKVKSAKVWAGGGAVYELYGTIWESVGLKKPYENWTVEFFLHDKQ